MWTRLYKDSTANGGTLKQLQHLINRTNVPQKPKKDVNAAEDFVQIVTLGHVIASAMQFFKMTKVDDTPDNGHLNKLESSKSQQEKGKLFHVMISDMLKQYLIHSTLDSPDPPQSTDKVNMYARETMTLGLLLVEFEDAIKEGDGERVLQCWKFFLLIFKSARRKNYAIEAFTLLAQFHALLPPRLREQLLWSRFVNTKGKPASNIPADLHNEHINRVAKMALTAQGSNLKPKTVERTGKIIGPMVSICAKFDEASRVHKQSSRHSVSSFKKDLDKIVTQLTRKSRVFEEQQGRTHSAFPNLNAHIVKSLKIERENFILWMKKQFTQLRVR